MNIQLLYRFRGITVLCARGEEAKTSIDKLYLTTFLILILF